MFVLSGENSMLARYILPVLRESSQVFAFNQEKGSIEDEGFLSSFMDEIKPKVFINCEQLDDPEECEYNREYAYRLNGIVPAVIARLCSERDIILVHFSTSHIFNGAAKTPYTEDDIPDPVSVYGDSKLMGEIKIKDSGCRHLIIRLPEVYGEGRTFLSKIFESVRNTGNVHIIGNQIISTIYAKDAARTIRDLIASGSEGAFNIANDGNTAAIEFTHNALELYRRYSGKEIIYRITEIDYEEYLTPSGRPLYGVLDAGKCAAILGKRLRPWKEAIDEFMSRFHMNM